MNKQAFMEELLRLAKEAGCEEAETYAAASESFSVNVLDGDFDRYESSLTDGVSLRVKVKGKDGYAYTEAFEDADSLVKKAMDNAAVLKAGEVHPMQMAKAYRTIEKKENATAKLSPEERIELARRMEKTAKECDERVIRMAECMVGVAGGSVEMKNTLGLNAAREAKTAFCFCETVIKDGDEIRTGGAFRSGDEVLDVDGCAKEAVRDALDKLHSAPVKSGRYTLILKNSAAADILGGFSSVFSAEAVQKGLSLLKDKEGETIASSCVTVWDDPTHPMADIPFDDEGTPTYRKAVVDNGTLTTFLHNLKTAAKAGCESTGNASRPSAASAVGVAPSVFYMEAGEGNFDTLVAEMADGLVITDVEGLHSGLNSISGDFSLKAQGYLVEDGKRVRAVNEITVAGNFLELLKNVKKVGSDLKFGLPFGSIFGSPSLLIENVAVGGK